MTYGDMLAASILRSVAVVILGLAAAELLAAWIISAPPRKRRWRWGLAMAPFLAPNLIVGFGYRGLSLNLLTHPWWNELLYLLLIGFETAPAAAWLLLHSGEPAVSEEAIHCARLASPRPGSFWRKPLARWSLWRRGPVSRRWGPAAVLFVLSFQESELSSLMQVRSWPERVFTEATRGLPPLEAMKLVTAPLLLQCLVLLPVWTAARALRRGNPNGRDAAAPRWPGWTTRGPLRLAVWVWLTAAILFVIGQPVAHLLENAWKSGRTLLLQPRWIRELGDAVLLAMTCTAVTWGAACLALPSRRKRPRIGRVPTTTLLAASLLPGLMGSLALGLTMSAVFQKVWPGWAYTPLPLVVAELFWLWPRALVVCGALGTGSNPEVHSLRLLEGSDDARQRRNAWRVWWIVAGRGLTGGVLLVWWWSYLEVMLPELLRTPGFQPAPWFLYNHLHFGQIPALGAKLLLILSAPAAILIAAAVALRRLAR